MKKLNMKTTVFLLGILLTAGTVHGRIDDGGRKLCKSSTEYITTINYLRAKKVFALKENQMRKVASEVSLGCSGAAKNFIRVVDLLLKAKVGSSTAVKTAIRFSREGEKTTDSFMEVFKNSFWKHTLDLDIHSSLKMALKLSIDFQGNNKKALKDFKKLVDFCINLRDSGLAPKSCAQFAGKVTVLGKDFKQELSKSYIELFNFLRSQKGPDLNINKSLNLALELIEYGPISSKNFKEAYRFSMSKKGFNSEKKRPLSLQRQWPKDLLKRLKIPSKTSSWS